MESLHGLESRGVALRDETSGDVHTHTHTHTHTNRPWSACEDDVRGPTVQDGHFDVFLERRNVSFTLSRRWRVLEQCVDLSDQLRSDGIPTLSRSRAAGLGGG